MKNLTLAILCAVSFLMSNAQCESLGITVSSSSETSVQLFTPTPFFVPNPEANMHFWDISDSNGNTIIQETTDNEGNLFLFEHNVPLTDTIIACLTVSNELAGPGIDCVICDSLTYQGSIIEWAILNNNAGTIQANQPPIPNYFVIGQSAPCPPRTVNFQNFTWGSDSVLWTFPGGDIESSTENNQLVTYNTAGTFSFTLEAFNEAGSTSLTVDDEVVVFPNPVADFSFSTDVLNVDFENLSEADLNPDQTIVYLWDFGDDNTSTEENPAHLYDEEGVYDVMLSVTNQCGTSEINYEVSVTSIGVNEIEDISSLQILPNPTNGEFEIRIQGQLDNELQLTLKNAIGQTVLTQPAVLNNGVYRTIISNQNLNSGIYVLTAISGGVLQSVKLIVE